MATCQYCGKRESTRWNLAGYTCTGCRPSCPECGKADRLASRAYVLLDGRPMKWCQGCGQLLPLAHVTAEPPVEDPPGEYADVAGLTYADADGVDRRKTKATVEWSDVPTYNATELVDQHGIDPDILAEPVKPSGGAI